MRTVFRGGDVLVPGADGSSTSQRADLLVDGQTIATIGAVPLDVAVDETVDATGHVLIPGLVNGHLHSWEALFRGRYPCLPLEVWGLYAYPLIAEYTVSPRLAYLRTASVAAESLLNGVTTVLDDVYETRVDGYTHLSAVFDAYRDVGIRANCSSRLFDRRYLDAIPYLNEYLEPSDLQELTALGTRGTKHYIGLCEQALSEFHGSASGRLRYVLAPSGPQRCTPELIRTSVELAAQHDSVVHIHVLETKMQALSGPELLGMSMLVYLDGMGALSERTTIAHGVWLSDHEIDLVAERGVTVVHNPVSNLKLGSGIAPLAAYRQRGVPIALGTDGISSNDSARMFEVMKLAALLPTMAETDYQRWPTADYAFHAATHGGARSLGLADRIGTLAPGMCADIVMIDTRTSSFTPLNDVIRQLVFAENGSSVRHVMVDGEMVVRGGVVQTIDQHAVLDELRTLATDFIAQHAQVEQTMARFEPAIAQVYERVMATPWPEHRRLPNGAGPLITESR
ncbi:MAG: 5-methylthioadenosine/S-adenosylhomocysteine deaminase [Pseudonocardiales bacterium]|nr:5-methylthioadenosine/S-adenosylhomocysteine deaminase [Pseudonocardiales bacterium]